MPKNKRLPPKLTSKTTWIENTYLEKSKFQGKNIENMIGATQVPLGIAGPINIPNHGKALVPLATTEGALVASVNRGLKAIELSGSLIVHANYQGMTRGPSFVTKNQAESQKIAKAIKLKELETLKSLASKTSNHIKLLKVQTKSIGKYIYIRFRFDTDEAMGMNMVTITTQILAQYLKNKFNITYTAISANFCVDKKIAYANWFFGRGYEVNAEATIPKTVLKKVLKTTASKIKDVYNQKIIYGSWITGTIGSYNAQFANIIAAIYLATGQDLGHVGENSQGILMLEEIGEDLYVNVWLPSLNIGTIGGGTKLPAQKEAIDLATSSVSQKTKKSAFLAKIVAAAVLAGELSLLSAIAQQSLSDAHKQFSGRKK